MTLITTARLCLRSPAEELGIEDESIAQAFNIECGIIWDNFEQERESERLTAYLAALATGSMPKRIKIETEKFNEQSF